MPCTTLSLCSATACSSLSRSAQSSHSLRDLPPTLTDTNSSTSSAQDLQIATRGIVAAPRHRHVNFEAKGDCTRTGTRGRSPLIRTICCAGLGRLLAVRQPACHSDAAPLIHGQAVARTPVAVPFKCTDRESESDDSSDRVLRIAVASSSRRPLTGVQGIRKTKRVPSVGRARECPMNPLQAYELGRRPRDGALGSN